MTTSVRFTQSDLDLFAAASHDRNPLHLSAMYARRTPMGQQVVYGVLGALACLGHIARPGRSILSLTLEFDRPVFLDTEYRIVVESPTAVRMMDGSTRLMRVAAEFGDAAAAAPALDHASSAPREIAVNPEDAKLMAGLTAVGEFRPDAEAAARLAERFGIPADAAGSIEFAVLLLSSYIVGMEVPGERALYFKGSFRFAATTAPESGPMTWSTKVVSRNAFNLLRQDLTVFMAGTTVCEAKISAMVRPMAVRTAVDTLPRSQVFRGRTALVIGASRGLGAAIASALVKQGATVLGSYLHGATSMEALAGSLVGESGTLVPVQGNAADAAWCSSILAQHGPPDYLILNACPTVRALKLERETLSRIHSYLDEAFGLVSVPVAVFAGEVRSCTVLISSIYVEEPVKDFRTTLLPSPPPKATSRSLPCSSEAGIPHRAPPETPHGHDQHALWHGRCHGARAGGIRTSHPIARSSCCRNRGPAPIRLRCGSLR